VYASVHSANQVWLLDCARTGTYVHILLVLIRLRLRSLGLSQPDGSQRGFDDVPRPSGVGLSHLAMFQSASGLEVPIWHPGAAKSENCDTRTYPGHYDGDQRQSQPAESLSVTSPSWQAPSHPFLVEHLSPHSRTLQVTNDNSRPAGPAVTWDKHGTSITRTTRDEGPQRPATQPGRRPQCPDAPKPPRPRVKPLSN
jgi:hypothetical protein